MAKKNDRVRLVYTNDPHTRLKPGTEGTVSLVDSMGTVHVKWDDGSRLGMIPGEDVIEVLEPVSSDRQMIAALIGDVVGTERVAPEAVDEFLADLKRGR